MKQANEGYDMSVKRYVAADMRQALKQIREELGPDAVILSNRRIEGGVEIITSTEYFTETAVAAPATSPLPSRQLADNIIDRTGENRTGKNRFLEDSFPDDKVELNSVYTARGRFEQAAVNNTAAPSSSTGNQAAAGANTAVNQPAMSQPHAQAQSADAPTIARRSSARQRRYIEEQLGDGKSVFASGQAQIDDTFEHLLGQYGQPAANSSNSGENGPVLDAMRSEIESLRLLLKDQMEHTSDDRWALKNPVEAAVVKRLVAEGISGRVARDLVGGLGPHDSIESAWNEALQDLAMSIPILNHDLMSKNGVIALLGATGVGKTTTIAKLAVRYALEHGPDQLALVTTDSYRLAAYEQLRTLGRIIDVPVRQVDEYNSLEDVLKSLKHKSMVLIDTAGFHLGDKDRLQQLELLDNVETPIKKLLVLPSTSQSKVLESVYELMAKVKLDGCVLSKMDESSSLGEVLSLVVEKRLPVAYITNGQKIPNDIGKARAEKLVQGLNRAQPISQPMGNTPFNNIRKPAPVFAGQHA